MTCPHPDKRKFRTRKAAKRAAKPLASRHGSALRAYLCGCGMWHLATVRNLAKVEAEEGAS